MQTDLNLALRFVASTVSATSAMAAAGEGRQRRGREREMRDDPMHPAREQGAVTCKRTTVLHTWPRQNQGATQDNLPVKARTRPPIPEKEA
jgi:hypothetical protein